MSDARGRVRLGCEALEARDVPAGFEWYGAVSTDANDPLNWCLPAGAAVPGAGDSVWVADGPVPDCVGLSGAVDLIGLPPYFRGHVVVSGTLTASFVSVSGGSLDLPDGARISSALVWTGGALNSTSTASTIEMLPGSTATIDPAAGNLAGADPTLGLTLGSTLVFDTGTPGSPTFPPPAVPTSPPPPTGGPGGGSDGSGGVGLGGGAATFPPLAPLTGSGFGVEPPSGAPGAAPAGPGGPAPAQPKPGAVGTMTFVNMLLVNNASFLIGTAADPLPPSDFTAKFTVQGNVTRGGALSMYWVRAGGLLTVTGSGNSNTGPGLRIDGGTVAIDLGVNAIFAASFVPTDAGEPNYNVIMSIGTLSLQTGAKLTAPDGVNLTGGLLMTQIGPGDNEGRNATIETPRLDNSGADVVIINDIAIHPTAVGELICTGDVNWTGGTYYIDVNPGAGSFDVWRAVKTFTIGQGAKIKVGYIGEQWPKSTETFGVIRAAVVQLAAPTVVIDVSGINSDPWEANINQKKDALRISRVPSAGNP